MPSVLLKGQFYEFLVNNEFCEDTFSFPFRTLFNFQESQKRALAAEQAEKVAPDLFPLEVCRLLGGELSKQAY